jgi:uncharacterized protein YegP (UPF0339 family)
MTHYRVYRDVQGYWRWTLLADNNRKIANSGEGYGHRQDCRSAIELVKSSGPAPIYESWSCRSPTTP